MATVAGVTAFVLRLPAGVLADTRSRLAIVVGADIGRAAALLTLPIASLAHALSLWHLAAVAVLDAALGACFEPAEAAALRHIVAVEQLPEAAARNQSRAFIATLLGPSAGLAGALAAPRLTARFGPRGLMVAFGWCAALVTPLLCLARSPYLIGAVGAVVFFLGPAANAGIVGHVLVHAPEGLQGRVHAAAGLITGAAAPAGPLVAGLLLQRAGPVATVAVSSSLLLLLAVAATFGVGGAQAKPIRRAVR